MQTEACRALLTHGAINDQIGPAGEITDNEGGDIRDYQELWSAQPSLDYLIFFCLFVCLISERPRQQQGYIMDGPQDSVTLYWHRPNQ